MRMAGWSGWLAAARSRTELRFVIAHSISRRAVISPLWFWPGAMNRAAPTTTSPAFVPVYLPQGGGLAAERGPQRRAQQRAWVQRVLRGVPPEVPAGGPPAVAAPHQGRGP